MGWTVSPFVLIEFGSAAVALAVGLAALRERPDPMAWPLATLMFAAAAWAVPHAISLGYADVEQVAFWHRLRYPGTVFAPLLYLVVTATYAGREQWLSRRNLGLLAVVPVLTIAIVWTNPAHGLFWQSLSTVTVDGATVLVPRYGPWYWVNLCYLYLLTVTGLAVLTGVMIETGRVYRKQAAMMFAGGAVPLGTNVVINLGVLVDPTVDLTTTAMTVSGLMFALALFHFDLLQIRPVARNRLIEELDDGVVVVGPNGRIRDFNPISAKILPDLRVDCLATDVLSSRLALDGGDITATVDGAERTFRSRTTALTDGDGRTVGRVVYLNEITGIVEREQRLSVLNRILRHNIRNELNIVEGYLDQIESASASEHTDYIRTAKASTRRISDFAEKARVIEQTLQASETGETVSVERVADRVVADARTTYPGAIVEYDCRLEQGDTATVRVADGDLFEMALTELVENAVVHNDADRPHVTVRVTAAENGVRVSVIDNGPGIPDEETAVLTARAETPLPHGSGLGLWLVSWTASAAAAELSFTTPERGGTVVSLVFDAAE